MQHDSKAAGGGLVVAGLAGFEGLDALALAALVRAGTVSASDLLEAAIARILAVDPLINAVVHPLFGRARAAVAAGLPQGPFTGVPFLVKDLGLDLEGAPATLGSALLRGTVSAHTSTLALRHAASGLVTLGKTAIPEFAQSFTTEPQEGGPTRNPWNTAFSSGGSSGGSAAAVAAGMVPLAHATDGAGSIRVPASHCGLFGFKPGRLRTPMGPDLLESIAGLSQHHAVTWTVRDSAALLDATAGPEPGDAGIAPPPAGSFLAAAGRDPAPMRIGLMPEGALGEPVHPACRAATLAAARLLESCGHIVEPAAPVHDAAAVRQAWRVIAGVALAAPVEAARAAGVTAPLEPVNECWFREGRQWRGTDYLAATEVLQRAARAVGRFFLRYDALLTPAAAEPPLPLGELVGTTTDLDAFYDRFWRHGPFTALFNAAGTPAASIPFAITAGGLPLGVQLATAGGAEERLFSLAGQIERAQPWFGRALPAAV